MATIGQATLAILAGFLADTSATKFSLEPVRRQDEIDAGVTQVGWVPIPTGYEYDSNDAYLQAVFPVRVIHRLADPDDEWNDYIIPTMLVDLQVTSNAAWWSSHAEVYSVVGDIKVTEPRRVGNIIEYDIEATILITPN